MTRRARRCGITTTWPASRMFWSCLAWTPSGRSGSRSTAGWATTARTTWSRTWVDWKKRKFGQLKVSWVVFAMTERPNESENGPKFHFSSLIKKRRSEERREMFYTPKVLHIDHVNSARKQSPSSEAKRRPRVRQSGKARKSSEFDLRPWLIIT